MGLQTQLTNGSEKQGKICNRQNKKQNKKIELAGYSTQTRPATPKPNTPLFHSNTSWTTQPRVVDGSTNKQQQTTL